MEDNKVRGAKHFVDKKKNAKKYVSRSVYFKNNSVRGMRKRNDRTSHHRRRNQVRNILTHVNLDDIGAETMPQPTSTYNGKGRQGCLRSFTISMDMFSKKNMTYY
jgi:hypothetical protein